MLSRPWTRSPGTHKLVPTGRRGGGVYNVNGTFYAIANYCPHQGGPLCSGRARDCTIVDENAPGDAVMVQDLEYIYCPWHQRGFELATRRPPPGRFGGENMKDVAGYDTKRLFIGSHNAFGTISTAISKITLTGVAKLGEHIADALQTPT